ncbi:PHP domain-containing protein [Salisaeta longa]|uniref:PHP domain-containing protein n=1 Tax=Salisaeta longa TaxID=503170 RepID=UPI0003B64DEA|nr:PHP domain-containing protein [Salisaeta longa]
MYADLHLHTHCSDGRDAPGAVVAALARTGLAALAITDHDTFAGVEAAQQAATQAGLKFCTGVELSVTVDGTGVHLLAYGCAPQHPAMQAHLDAYRTTRETRLHAILERLNAHDIPLTMDDVRAATTPVPDVWGRPHVARALVAGGWVATEDDAFREWLREGRPAYVANPGVPAAGALERVHAAGGVGVLAHPGHWTSTATIQALIDAGLDGLEVMHPSHEPYLVRYYRQLADRHGLLQTGGSDDHGEPAHEARRGRYGISRQHWERLCEAIA